MKDFQYSIILSVLGLTGMVAYGAWLRHFFESLRSNLAQKIGDRIGITITCSGRKGFWAAPRGSAIRIHLLVALLDFVIAFIFIFVPFAVGILAIFGVMYLLTGKL